MTKPVEVRVRLGRRCQAVSVTARGHQGHAALGPDLHPVESGRRLVRPVLRFLAGFDTQVLEPVGDLGRRDAQIRRRQLAAEPDRFKRSDDVRAVGAGHLIWIAEGFNRVLSFEAAFRRRELFNVRNMLRLRGAVRRRGLRVTAPIEG